MKMDKQKIIRIILNDLDELKSLSEEIEEAENDASLIVNLALSKARLLVQEIELLHEYSSAVKTTKPEDQQEASKVSEEEDSEISYSDPELEVLHFDIPGTTEEVASEPDETEEEIAAPDEKEEEEEEADETETEEEIQGEENIEPEELEDNPKEEEEEEIVVYDEEEEEKEEEPELETVKEPEVEVNKLEDDSQTNVREIHIDELDDDEADSFKFTPKATAPERPVFHEIPKPDNSQKEKQVIGEKFKKEPSLNDSMAEKRSTESKLTNGNGPISSLRASIGLNDRFLFIREIFDNNAERYNMIIDHLDKLHTIQQAVEYLKSNLTLEKNDTSMKFVDLLKRRFTK